ncbi:MAG: response regulator [Polyangiales bacterium]
MSESHDHSPSDAPAAPAVVGTSPRQWGVLVVEDDPDTQWRLARMLTMEGHRVVGTSSGDGALALVGEWSMDLVLVDETLPGMDGLEVAQRIRERHPNMPVVLMTDEPSDELEMSARVAGVAATLAKPFRAEGLIRLLEQVAVQALSSPAAE